MKHIGTKRLETKRLILRRFNISDYNSMYNNWANDDNVTRHITWKTHQDENETKKVIENYLKEYEKDTYYHWLIELKATNEAVGSIGAFRVYDDIETAEVGYCIGKKFWNKGITTEAMHEIIRFLFEEVNANRIEARYDTKNPASGKVMEKSGMIFEGVLRQAGKNNTGICDSAVYSLLKKKWLDKNK